MARLTHYNPLHCVCTCTYHNLQIQTADHMASNFTYRTSKNTYCLPWFAICYLIAYVFKTQLYLKNIHHVRTTGTKRKKLLRYLQERLIMMLSRAGLLACACAHACGRFSPEGTEAHTPNHVEKRVKYDQA